MFLDVINDNSLEQFVHLPTRLENTLDLVFCTYPKIVNISTVPGISDHDALTFHLDIHCKQACNSKYKATQNCFVSQRKHRPN